MTLLQNFLNPPEQLSAKAEKLLRRSQSNKFLLFRGAALTLQSCNLPEVIISGPSETGKTIAACNRLHQLALTYRGFQGAIVRKVRHDMDSTVLQTWRKVISGYEVSIYGGERPDHYDYANGSRIWIGGMDRPGSVLSGERDAIYVNQAEELALEDWETITTRTTGRAGNMPYGQTFGDCNPGPPSSWILHRDSLNLLYSRHEDNPMLYDDSGQITAQGQRTMTVLDALTGVRKERLRHGRWVSAEGTVYEFDPAIHEIDPFPVPKEWRRIGVVDFGYTNPFVFQLWAIDPDDRAYLYREIYMTRRTVRAHSEQIKELIANESIEIILADHDAEDRATLEENGIYTVAADKDISPGIQAVQERLRVRADGKPGMMIMRGALVERDQTLAEAHKPVCTREEFDVYAWPKDSSGRAIKEMPVKMHDHGMDATRYLFRYLSVSNGQLFYE